MADYTENYNLKRPERTDFVNIQDINQNMDIIDGALKMVEDSMDNGEIKGAIEDVDAKIGSSSDTDTSTLFGAVKNILSNLTSHIGIWTFARAGKVDSIDTNTSINNTGSTTGTLSQKLTYLLTDWTTMRATKIDSIDTKIGMSEDSGTTVMGKLNDINSKDKIYVSSAVEREIILSSPVNSPSGSGYKLVRRYIPKRNGTVNIKVSIGREDGSANPHIVVMGYGGQYGFPTDVYTDLITIPEETVAGGALQNSQGQIYIYGRSGGGVNEANMSMPVFSGWPLSFVLLGGTTPAARVTVNSIKICYDEVVS